MDTIFTKEFNRIRTIHQTKFKRLQMKLTTDGTRVTQGITQMSTEETNLIKQRWLRNLSSRQLTASEESVLKRGLNFAVTPSKIPVVDMIVGIETACKYINPNSEEATTLRTECTRILKSAKPPKSNISKEELQALSSLKQDSSIIILPADKGRSTVVMDKQQYHDNRGGSRNFGQGGA